MVLVFSDVLEAFLYFATSGKYQNTEKSLKHQRRLGLSYAKKVKRFFCILNENLKKDDYM